MPDFPGQGSRCEGLVFGLGAKGLNDLLEQHWSAGTCAGVFVYV